MENSKTKRYRLAIAILVFALCMAAAHALAANATTVYVNGAELTSATPYWENGGGSGSATEPVGGWNAYFDTSTAIPTLKLDGAVINSPYISENYRYLIHADGDIILTLTGSSTLSYSGNASRSLMGIHTSDDLVIAEAAGETGSLTVNITNTNDGYGTAYGIHADYDLTIESGTVNINTNSMYLAYSISATRFYMTAGSVAATASAPDEGTALRFCDAYITGGEGRFESVNDYGLAWFADGHDFSVTGGHMIFSSANNAALYFATHNSVLPDSSVPIWVSTDSGGAGKAVWDSSIGRLASNYNGYSGYKYVEFSETGVVSPQIPQTGDAQTPWLWLCAGLIALLGAAGTTMLLRRKRRA